MNSKPPISVVSTYATDILVDSEGYVISKQKGGPLLFIDQALKKSSVDYKVFTGQPMVVEILINDEGEFGKVSKQPTTRELSAVSAGKWVLVSTILDEWTINPKANIPEKLFIDIQGYVRDGHDFGNKKRWDIHKELTDKIYCLKGTEEEIKYLPTEVVKSQQQRLLLITKGIKGIKMYYKGKVHNIPVKAVEGLKDSLGAGDTFLANFVIALYRGNTPYEAATIASEETTKFLEEKLVNSYA